MFLLTEKLKGSVLKIDKTKPQQEIVYLTTLWWKIEKSGSCLTNAQGLEKTYWPLSPWDRCSGLR